MSRSKTSLMSFAIRRTELNRYAKLISSEWQKATASIISVSRHCAKANDELTTEEKRELLLQLPFGQSVFSKLSAIGKDARLNKPSLLKLLPPNYSTIYEVTHLSNAKLNEAIKREILHPKISRAEIISFVKGKKISNHNAKQSKSNLSFFVEIRLPANADRNLLAKANEFIWELEKASTTQIIRSIDLPSYDHLVEQYNKRLAKYQSVILKKIKMLIKQLISELKRNAKRKNKKWGFLPDELDMNVPMHELDERIKQVLETLGYESNYDDLRKKAEELSDFSPVDSLGRMIEEQFPFADSYTQSISSAFKKVEDKKERKMRFANIKVT